MKDNKQYKKMGFAVIHIEKGTTGKAGGLGNHIDRTKNVPNANPALTEKNFYVRVDEKDMMFITKEREAKNLQERINNRIQKGYKGKTAIRKDAVTHLNIILSGSHKDMKEIERNSEALKEWALLNFAYIAERFGYENIVEFSCHLDERTPHIHCVVVPLTKDGRLSAKEVMGNRHKMSELQDSYGNLMQKAFGLQRGIKGSTATHDSVREYYARINQSLNYPYFIELNNEVRSPQITTPPLIGQKKWVESQNKMILEWFNRMARHYKAEAEEQCQKVFNFFQNSKIQAEEKADRLRKENCQLKGIIKEQDKQLHPERYAVQTRKRAIHR